MRESPHIALACKQAGIGRTAAYKARKNDPEFARQWTETLDAAVDDLETTALKFALQGNVPLIMFLLKSHRPQVYSRPEQHQHAVLGRIVILPEKENRDDETRS